MFFTRHGSFAMDESSPEDVIPVECPAFKRFVQHLNNFDGPIVLVHQFGKSAKYTLQCSKTLREKIFVVFQAHADDYPYEEPHRVYRVDDIIYILLRDVTAIHHSVLQYMYENPGVYGQCCGSLAGNRITIELHKAACAPTISSRTDFSFRSRRRANNENPNIVGAVEYETPLGAEVGCHQRMKRFLVNPAILAGIVVKINHPWNYQNHYDNSIVLFYYERPPDVPQGVAVAPVAVLGPAAVVPTEPNGARPSFGIILGRQLTAAEIDNLVATTGLNPDFLYGHGRVQRPPGAVRSGSDPVAAGRCWFANAGDDDVYRFHIPARVLMLRENPQDDVIIGGVRVDFNDLPETANVTINCKHLMQYVANGVDSMPVPPGGNPIDLAPYGGQVNYDVVRGPLGDAVVPLGHVIGGHNIGFLANGPGGTALPRSPSPCLELQRLRLL